MKQAERQERSRSEILRAAMEEFGTHAYEEVSVESICSVHGISKGMMYHYYSGKETLFLLCVGHVFESLCAFVRAHPMQSPCTGLDSVYALFSVREAYFRSRPKEKNVFEEAMFRTPRALEGEIDRLREPLRALNVERLQQAARGLRLRRSLTAEQVTRYLESVEHAFWTLIRQYNQGKRPQDLRQMEEISMQILDMALFGVIEPPDAPGAGTQASSGACQDGNPPADL